ncbi:hypothetical protein NPIL_52541 [Nephila pilipes]|uniref:Uncharacterized protein n=1 Tax=Nephila pilipes TaxID=299642 RepID=A0A8X6N4L2_NEPPI|nr:hypothetical protein NPIL_52541 [Nephila pilipes]
MKRALKRDDKNLRDEIMKSQYGRVYEGDIGFLGVEGVGRNTLTERFGRMDEWVVEEVERKAFRETAIDLCTRPRFRSQRTTHALLRMHVISPEDAVSRDRYSETICNMNALVFMFDISRSYPPGAHVNTLAYAYGWFKRIRDSFESSMLPFTLVGNKLDYRENPTETRNTRSAARGEGIDEESFVSLGNETLKSLIPKAGAGFKFKKYLNSFIQTSNFSSESISDSTAPLSNTDITFSYPDVVPTASNDPQTILPHSVCNIYDSDVSSVNTNISNNQCNIADYLSLNDSESLFSSTPIPLSSPSSTSCQKKKI